MQKYIILRDSNREHNFRSPARSGSSPADFTFDDTRILESAPATGLPVPAIRTNSLSGGDVQDAARDADVEDLAIVMPTILPAPVPLDAGEAAGSNWGVAAVGATGGTLTGTCASVCTLDSGIDASPSAFAGISLAKRDFTTGVENGEVIDNRDNWDDTALREDVFASRYSRFDYGAGRVTAPSASA